MTEKEAIDYSIDQSIGIKFKQIKYKGTLLTLIKIGDSYIPLLGDRNLNFAIKQGKQEIDMNEVQVQTNHTSIDEVRQKLKEIPTDNLIGILDEDAVQAVMKDADADFTEAVENAIQNEIDSRLEELDTGQNNIAVSDEIISDKIRFYQNLIPDGSLFAKQNVIGKITEFVDVNLESEQTEQTLISESSNIVDAQDDVLLREALTSFGIKVPLVGIDEFYNDQKELDFLLEAKVGVFTQTKMKEKQVRQDLNEIANDASNIHDIPIPTPLEQDNKDELKTYRDLIKKIKTTATALKLTDTDTDYLDTALEEWNNFTALDELDTLDIDDTTLLGKFIKAEKLREKLITPIQNVLDNEIDGHSGSVHYNHNLMVFHERRDTGYGAILIKREMKPTAGAYSEKYASFSFNVVTTNEAEQAIDFSVISSLNAEQDKVNTDKGKK